MLQNGGREQSLFIVGWRNLGQNPHLKFNPTNKTRTLKFLFAHWVKYYKMCGLKTEPSPNFSSPGVNYDHSNLKNHAQALDRRWMRTIRRSSTRV